MLWLFNLLVLAQASLAITHVGVVDVRAGKIVSDRTVVIRGRTIVIVGDARSTDVSPETRTIDGRGKFLIPGLWDMHVHLDESDLAALLTAGITGARDMGGDLEQLLSWRRRGPRLVFAGPVLRGPRSENDTGSAGAWVIRTAEQGARAVDSLALRGVDFIKVHEDLSREAYFAIAYAAKARHLPFVGHVAASLTPIQVSEAGQRSIEHLEFVPDRCLGVFAGQQPSGCAAAIDSVVDALSRNGTWLDPTIGSFRIFAKQQFPAILAGFKTLVPALRAHHIKLLAGTDLGTAGIIPGASLHDELSLLVAAGFTPLEALRAATLNPAEFLDATDSLGTIEAGKLADLVLLRADPLRDISNTRSIAAVIRDGRVCDPHARDLAHSEFRCAFGKVE